MLKSFTQYLYDSIPLTAKMELSIDSFENDELCLHAPLSVNINDKGSVFGGSSSALMIIAAWSLIKLNCQQHDIQADIVIHKNETHWQKALFDDLFITAKFKNPHNFEQIKAKISANKHQRLTCLIELADNTGKIYSKMTAKYVIIPKK